MSWARRRNTIFGELQGTLKNPPGNPGDSGRETPGEPEELQETRLRNQVDHSEAHRGEPNRIGEAGHNRF